MLGGYTFNVFAPKFAMVARSPIPDGRLSVVAGNLTPVPGAVVLTTLTADVISKAVV